MRLETTFRAALRDRVGALLKQAGFLSTRDTYRRMKMEVLHLVSVQKSRASTAQEIIFTVNLGVASLGLLASRDADPMVLRVDQCHWRRRLGVGRLQEDTWWTVRDASSAQDAAGSVAEALRESGLPTFDQLSGDAALRDVWLSGQSPGLTDPQRLLYLAMLTRRIGPQNVAQAVIHDLKEVARTTHIPSLIQYLKEVGEG